MTFLEQFTTSKPYARGFNLWLTPYWLEFALAVALIVLGAGAAGLIGVV